MRPARATAALPCVPLQRVRWPKVGAPALSMSVVRNPNKSAPVFDINSTRPQSWRKHSWTSASQGGGGGVWIDGILSQNWVWTFNRATGQPRERLGSYSLAAAEAISPTTSITYCCHNRFFFSNVYDELSEIGEYYGDEAALQVYLVAPKVLRWQPQPQPPQGPRLPCRRHCSTHRCLSSRPAPPTSA